MKLSISKRYLLVAMGLLLIAAVIWLDAARRFVKAGEIKAPDISEVVAVGDGDATDAWSLLFERRVPPQDQFAVIAEKNVFSPLRKAWAPPPPPPAEPEAPVVEETPVLEPPRREDVELRGTAMVGETRKAILGFKSFRPPQTLLLAEGEVASEKEIKDGPRFTVVRIENESVRIKDAEGREFLVGLFDHRREAPAATVNQSTVELAPQIAPQSEAPPAEATILVGGASDNVTPSKLSSDQLRQKNEQLVKEGKMKKIYTPFGPVYRKQ
jgi:hypothetical protein